jgi:hypothetical protein
MFHFFSLLRKSNLKNAFALFLMLTPMVIYAGQNLKKYEAGSPTSDRLSVTVTCQVTLSSGESPEGALLTLTGVNNPALYHEQYAPESGEVIFAGVIEANYRLRAVLQGYYELDTLITILDNLHIPVFLQEIMNNPHNLSVDSLSLCVRWQAPVPAYAGLIFRQPEIMKTGNKTPVLQSKKSGAFSGKRSFTGYGVFLDGELVGNTPDTSFVFEPLIYGQSYLAGVAAIYSSGYSEIDTCRFTSRFLFPPRNISGETPAMTDYCHITWEAPEDPQNPGQAVPGITGYKIYRNQVVIAYVTSDTNEYYDLDLVPVNYSYHVTALYDLTPYGFEGQTGESMIAGPVEVSVIYGYELPFVENFNTGLFETNQWTVEGNNNWRISGQIGNIAPSAEFYFYPVLSDYSLTLTSSYMIGSGYIDGSIMLDFDLKHTLVNATEDEKLKVEVFNGSEWVEVAEYVNNQSFDWESQSIDITTAAKGNIFKVRFTAHGIATTDIFNWMIDNIHVYRTCVPPTDLAAFINLPNIYDIVLNWEAPENNFQKGLIGLDNGTSHNAFGGSTENIKSSSRSLVGYNVFRDDELLTLTDTTFLIVNMYGMDWGYYYFKVSAVYTDCESEPTDEVWVSYTPTIAVSYQEIHNLANYPNPSTCLFYVDAEGLEGKLSVYSFSGKHLLETPISKNEKPVLSLEHFPVGAYLVKFVADSGETFTGKVIIAR